MVQKQPPHPHHPPTPTPPLLATRDQSSVAFVVNLNVFQPVVIIQHAHAFPNVYELTKKCTRSIENKTPGTKYLAENSLERFTCRMRQSLTDMFWGGGFRCRFLS